MKKPARETEDSENEKSYNGFSACRRIQVLSGFSSPSHHLAIRYKISKKKSSFQSLIEAAPESESGQP
jgi:hypothetical protein